MLRKNVAGQFLHFTGIVASTGAVLTGATFTYRRCIDGTFAAGGGTITEDTGTGFYKVALAQADTNGNDLGFFFTATTAVPVAINVITTAADPTDAVRLGLTGLANAVPGAAGGLFIAGTNAATSITTGLTAHIIGTVDTLTTYTGNTPQTGDVATLITTVGAAGAGLTAASAALLTTAITEAYRTNGTAPTLAQFMSEVLAHLGESAISSTTKTIKKLDHSTPAETFTLDDATTPSSITRAS